MQYRPSQIKAHAGLMVVTIPVDRTFAIPVRSQQPLDIVALELAIPKWIDAALNIHHSFISTLREQALAMWRNSRFCPPGLIVYDPVIRPILPRPTMSLTAPWIFCRDAREVKSHALLLPFQKGLLGACYEWR